jgi:hypothetical protein
VEAGGAGGGVEGNHIRVSSRQYLTFQSRIFVTRQPILGSITPFWVEQKGVMLCRRDQSCHIITQYAILRVAASHLIPRRLGDLGPICHTTLYWSLYYSYSGQIRSCLRCFSSYRWTHMWIVNINYGVGFWNNGPVSLFIFRISHSYFGARTNMLSTVLSMSL